MQTSNCQLSFIVFPFFWSQLCICFSRFPHRPHILPKKPTALTSSCFKENLKCYWIPKKEVKTGEIITYPWSNNVTALQKSLVSSHCSTHLLNSQKAKIQNMSPEVQLNNKLNWINKKHWKGGILLSYPLLHYQSQPRSTPSCINTDKTIVTM